MSPASGQLPTTCRVMLRASDDRRRDYRVELSGPVPMTESVLPWTSRTPVAVDSTCRAERLLDGSPLLGPSA